ncbi:hypothetical protein M408DRAFT_66180 [Serendipita vermifera MAFF 305830]|uniref:Uncharacterized protein n=1 Tax=Serendipita vermifera MAFF 305830 TaxID=933852 RepID=A0A0C2WWJ2_SERVB|nr:hypothetical protein M408DRAFT_66180 [Serendipita vermifera MAFF 305830]
MQKELPPELIIAVERILEPHKEYKHVQTNVQDTLNELFPTEESLLQISVVQAQLEEQRSALQAEVAQLSETLTKEQDPGRMQRIQELIAGLLSQMNRIREKATESEAIVRSITKDIQRLDHAKKNLALSMTTLKRLQMLVNGLEQLDIFVKERQYPQISQTLGAVKQLSIFFKPYMAIDRIAAVWRRFQESQGAVRGLVEEDFEAFVLKDPSKPISSTIIADCCLVVDVLGDDVRNHLIDKYCNMELKDYRRIFRPTDEAGQLDNLSRRFSWFRRILGLHEEEHANVFPASWNVGKILCGKFTEITAEDVNTLLSRLGPKLTVNLLLENLQHAIEFETFVSRKYGVGLQDVLASTPSKASSNRSISSAFEKYMGVFVDAQDRAISDMMAAYRGIKSRTSVEDQAIKEEDNHYVLSSSGDLFYFYAQTLEQCAKFTTGKPLHDLFVVFRKWLRIYAGKSMAFDAGLPLMISQMSLLITKFTNALVRSRPLRDTGAEQILLDFQALKSCLLRMPSTGDPESIPTTYTKAATKLTVQVETILKVVSAPVDPQEPFIMNYIVLIGDSSFSNFQKILDLKGIPGVAQNNLLDHFLTTTSTKDELPSTSFLSSLDMDPSASQITTRPSMDSGSHTPRSGTPGTDSPKTTERREVLSSLRGLVTFAVKRDRENKNQT